MQADAAHFDGITPNQGEIPWPRASQAAKTQPKAHAAGPAGKVG
jgi:hypothetical protein